MSAPTPALQETATAASRQKVRRDGLKGVSLAAPSALVVLLVIVLPGLQLVRYSFNQFDAVDLMREAFTLHNYLKFFTDPYYHQVLWTTVRVAALCTALALILGFPVAYVLAKSQSRFKSLLVMLLIFRQDESFATSV